MSDDNKAALWKTITSELDDWQLLVRMRELGFWPDGAEIPEEPPESAEERAKIISELKALRRQSASVQDPDKALALERVRRWNESKKRRALSKAERAEKAKARREADDKERARTIVHAGRGVSAGLADTESDIEALSGRGLPVLHEAPDLARAMGIELGALRWLTYHRRAAAVVHYHRYTLPKKCGGVRAISAPKPALAAAQRWVLAHVLQKLSVEPEAHGFVPTRGVISNASPHVGQKVVVNLDLKDFFPTLTFRRVKGLFKKLGYSEHVATLMALLTTEPPRVPMTLDGKVWNVALSDRVLPQGACTSPAITNAVCRRLDRRLRGLAARHGFTYTRYADDLTFSGADRRKVGLLLRSVRSILTDEGFVEHPKKTQVMGRGRRQEVTGVTVNDKLALSRKDKRRLRATLHNAAKHGAASQNRAGHPDFPGYLRGMVAWACQVEPDRAPEWKRALAEALRPSP
ncbi:MAG: reverse transcriptase domain-containing protein [Sandaracinaceae bacterium]